MGELVVVPSNTPAAAGQNSDLSKVLTQEHPVLAAYKPMWDKYIDTYEGDEIFKYLFQHLRENVKSFQSRQKRAYYYNYCSAIIDTYNSYLFRKPIVRAIKKKEAPKLAPAEPTLPTPPPQPVAPQPVQAQPPIPGQPPIAPQPIAPVTPPVVIPEPQMEDEDYKQFHEDCDGKGTKFSDWMKMSAILAQVVGWLGVVVDVPETQTDIKGNVIPPVSEADRKAQKLFPYCIRVFPTAFVNWELDDKGALLWIRYKEDPPSQIDPFVARDSTKAPVRYRTWTRDKWFVHEVRGNEVRKIAEGDHQLGRVPMAIIYNKHSIKNPFIGVSAINSASSINIGIFNWCSLIDEHLYQKCLSILVMQKRLDSEDEVQIGNSNVLEFDGTVQPNFIAPSSEPEKFILEQIEKAINEIYRIARLSGATGLQSREAMSGVAYSFEFNETNNLLAEKADNFEKGERDIHWLVGKWLNKGPDILDNLLIDYPEDFGLDDVNGELGTLKTIQDQCTSNTFKREVRKRLVKRILPKLDKQIMSVILGEIDVQPATPPPTFAFGGGGGGAGGAEIGMGAEPSSASVGEEGS